MRKFFGSHKIAAVSGTLLLVSLLGISSAAPGGQYFPLDAPTPAPIRKKVDPSKLEAARAQLEQERLARYWEDFGTEIGLGQFPDEPLFRQLVQELSVAGRSAKDRGRFYLWLNKDPEIRCNGWRGRLMSVEPTRDGLKVTLAVTPTISRPQGGGMSVMSLLETYVRTNKGWVHVMTKPDGVPGLIIFN